MSINYYTPPPIPIDEVLREKAVEASGALLARDDAILCDIAAEARRRFQAVTAAITIVYGDHQYLIAAAGVPTGLYSRRTSFCGHAIAAKARLFEVTDPTADARFAGNPWVNGDDGTVSFYAAALLRDAEGQALGALCVTDGVPRAPLTAPETAELLRLADRALDRLDRLRLRDAPPIAPAAARA